MDVTLECKKCPHRISTTVGQFTVCGGPCRKAFHLTCISMKRDTLCSLAENIIWFCDECLDIFRNWRDNTEPPADEVTREISELKKQVAGILEVIDSIKPTAQRSPSVPPIVEFRHSTPLSSTSLMNGTNVNSASEDVSSLVETSSSQQNVDHIEATEDEKNFSLFLTNVDRAVSEDEIRTMVYRCIGASDVEYCYVKKLVSKYVDARSMDSVSFRVTLDVKWKPLAMKTSTWPCEIKFREFINHRARRWRPVH